VQRLNELKDREDFRPVAPAVLEEAAAEYFDGVGKSPFMLFTFPVRKERERLVPAIRHVDGSARIQTVSRGESPLYYRMIEEFARLTGIPVVVNTSFNTRGKPIVCTPEDALACFYTAPIDALALGSFWLKKRGSGAPDE
jgi:carbamoyltransferase